MGHREKKSFGFMGSAGEIEIDDEWIEVIGGGSKTRVARSQVQSVSLDSTALGGIWFKLMGPGGELGKVKVREKFGDEMQEWLTKRLR